jgi:hypothetical protein
MPPLHDRQADEIALQAIVPPFPDLTLARSFINSNYDSVVYDSVVIADHRCRALLKRIVRIVANFCPTVLDYGIKAKIVRLWTDDGDGQA